MATVLITGMSGTGKSAVLVELGRRGQQISKAHLPQLDAHHSRYRDIKALMVVDDEGQVWGLTAMMASVRMFSTKLPDGSRASRAARRSRSKCGRASPSWAGLL